MGWRYSYVGANPVACLEIYPEKFWLSSNDRVQESHDNPLDWLERRMSQGPKRKTGDFFASGWAGFLSYEMASLADSILPQRGLEAGAMIGFFGLYEIGRAHV